MKQIAVLSPHLDDGIFSCGEYIYKELSKENQVSVITVFSGSAAQEDLSPAAKEFHSMCFLHDNDAMKIRKREDIYACRRLGCNYIHLGYKEYLYRTNLPDVKMCIAQKGMVNIDEPYNARLASHLEALCKEYDLILSPLGIGGHYDHLLIMNIMKRFAERRDAAVLFYEDVPYLCDLFVEGKVPEVDDMAAELITIKSEEWNAKVHASWYYFSQIQVEWRNEYERLRQMAEISSMYGPEHSLRFWKIRK